ncbi:sigma-70 family RNA polymerase sigma factor [Pseudomonas sp. 7P_10.2_Bac1]|uniref:sigma-70 family RNA polymerase sigma factor n=1 Tax=Pseudomonas sp. 7P_10.2_Bac1 TaxID=2971614 RepID=UPI0021C706F2|nr:sigma-70 family RNA polymerase sigma factor [Pseudomonas sp. 7P_10.2_Bac1]MCU1726069.1 sigma-70 family RNA polymerase sigma factor [Pseudomonas sp. 7P_10.2_Bac1]
MPHFPESSAPSYSVGSLYVAHHGWIQRYLARKLGNVSDAAELAHDVFVRLLGHPRKFDNEVHARAYLSRLSHNVCVDFFRRKHVERAWLEVLASRPEDCAPSEEHRALVLEALVHLQAMLDRLPAKVSEAFCLAQIEGLSYRQIALRIGVSERTVTKYIGQAMFQCMVLEAELDGALL